MVLLDDPYAGGLSAVLERWGLRVANPPGPQHLPVRISTTQFAEHPATRRLANVMTAFSNPCVIETLDSGPVAGRRDKPIVSPSSSFRRPIRAGCSLSGARARPSPPLGARRFRQGPRIAKLLVCGDSDFMSTP